MKFKDKIKILTDRGVFKEIKGALIPYEDKTVKVTLMAHLSEDAWQSDVLDVSEQSTGCRLFSIKDIKAKDVNAKIIIERTQKFIQSKGKKAFLEQIEKQILSNPHIYENMLDK